jgi:hypothetical protein
MGDASLTSLKKFDFLRLSLTRVGAPEGQNAFYS